MLCGKKQWPVKKRRNNRLAHTYQWGIRAYTVYTYMYVHYLYMHTHIRILGWCELCIYFGLDKSQLHCTLTWVGWPNSEKLVFTCAQIWSQPKWAQIITNQCKWMYKAWPNRVTVKPKFWTCIYLWIYLTKALNYDIKLLLISFYALVNIYGCYAPGLAMIVLTLPALKEGAQYMYRFWGSGIWLIWRPGFGIFKEKGDKFVGIAC